MSRIHCLRKVARIFSFASAVELRWILSDFVFAREDVLVLATLSLLKHRVVVFEQLSDILQLLIVEVKSLLLSVLVLLELWYLTTSVLHAQGTKHAL